MRFINRTICVEVYIRLEQAYNREQRRLKVSKIAVYSNGGLGEIDVNTPAAISTRPPRWALDNHTNQYFVYTAYVPVIEPGYYRMNFKVIDPEGNMSGFLQEFEQEAGCIPAPPSPLPYPEWDTNNRVITFNF